ncbi:TonB-dependent receptor [Nitrobacter winogradskyi]|uniref:Iron complex outermembrane receptor protein n=2 Tax=Nitrobacter winogradskyi TaxID=913 RepID=A0ACC6AEJ2_NITWI|nr:TonB-dependent siderophore receptor [Nitrobacter winogradskyi]MCP1997622.1 iron complex outermembrane receptor protein [Nitrobacter winogradskyi]GEC17107.1 ligand-gated channel [Nitrobacter winogradskyi]
MPSDRCHTRFHFRTLLSLPILMVLYGNAWAQDITLPTIDVQGRPDSNANADITRDYKVNRVELGPLGKRPLIDTPFSVNTVSEGFAENRQIQSVREAFRFIPSVQGENIRPQTRGLQASVVQNTLIDGLNIAATTDYPIEQFQRIDVLNGLAGALFGPAQPGGTFNYVMKRPTAVPLHRLTAGYLSQSQWLAHADIGGYADPEHRFGYRLNLLDQDGTSYVDNGRLRRQLASFGGDIRLGPDTVLETNASIYNYLTRGLPGTFAVANNVVFPAAVDPTRVGYGQPWGGDDNKTTFLSGRIKHDINENWRFSVGVSRNTSDRASTVPTNTIRSNAGNFVTTAATTTFSLDTVDSNQAALNGRFETGPIKHDLFLATNGFLWNRYTPFTRGAITVGNASLGNPLVFSEPNFPDFKDRYRSVYTFQQSVTLGDTVALNDQWSVLVAVSNSWINTSNYNSVGSLTGGYHASGWSPLGGIMFKPRENVTTYVTYANSLQQGDSAPAGTINQGEALAPFRSNQYELGAKFDLGRINLNAALYRIERPYAYTGSDNVFSVKGTQINRGVELMASGAINNEWTVFGGMTFIDPRLYNTGSPQTDGRRILGLSQFVMNCLVEYHVPAVQGLTFTANVNYGTNRPTDYANTSFVPDYAVLNLGMRYAQLVAGKPVTFRFDVFNVTDLHYWANVTPAAQNGYNATGSATGMLGAPRTVRASLQVEL